MTTSFIEKQRKRVNRLFKAHRRYVNMRVQYVQYGRNPEKDIPVRTGVTSKVYGGMFDTVQNKYIRDNSSEVIELACYDTQFDFITSDVPYKEGSGSRASGKSTTFAELVMRYMAERDGVTGGCCGPDFPKTEAVYNRLIERIPKEWIDVNIFRKDLKKLILVNGVEIKFLSATCDHRLRSYSFNWLGVDECQDVCNAYFDSLIPCVRDQLDRYPWTVFETGTIKPGDFPIRHEKNKRLEKTGDAKCFFFDVRNNPFLPKDLISYQQKHMTEIGFDVEILGDWDALKQLDGQKVFPMLVDEKHVLRTKQYEWMKDSYRDETASRCSMLYGFHKKYILSVDYNVKYPNYFTIMKIFEPGIIVVLDQILCSTVNQGIKEIQKSYDVKDFCVIDDQSGNKASVYSRELAPRRALLNAGFSLIDRGNFINPKVSETLHVLLKKLSYTEEEPPTVKFHQAVTGKEIKSLYYQPKGKVRAYNSIYEDMKAAVWNSAGDNIHKCKSNDITHSIDTLRYTAYYFFRQEYDKGGV